ncbi:MAG TPA: HAMP domain-containing histidine kinase [Clostridiales bacterium]|nr:HAMP domain-containing histidine kinase [Clostridiales bacterium]
MYSTLNNDTLASMLKFNPEMESVINAIVADHKKATSMLVHELRNPLTLIKSTLQYMESKHPEAKEFKYWDQLQDLIHDMEQIMADASLLNTMGIINKEETNLISLIESLVNSFMPQAITKELELSFDLDPAEKAYFTSYPCDSVKLKQVLTNLIKNAFEAAQQNGFIHISLAHLPGDALTPSKISIRVSNSGQPIPEDVLETIFVPFVTYKNGGTGIGLALVKKVVDMHYGSVHVESDQQKTSFIIHLPL